MDITDDPERADLPFTSDAFSADEIGLALSGGGYKAAAYHLGGLIRLEELGLLNRIHRIASVSGGSIAAGFLACRWKHLAFDPETGRSARFLEEFVQPLHDFLTNVDIDIPQILLGLALPFRSGADGLVAAYDRHLFHGATLQDLPDEAQGPRFVILATNYELNSLWRFSRAYAADWRVGRISAPVFSLARVVAASSAFPPFFCPIPLDFARIPLEPLAGADRTQGRFAERALLCDGGVYDNMGLEPIWKRCGRLLVSNAGDFIDEEDHPEDWAHMLLRILGMVHRQAENNRQRVLMALATQKERQIAYWPLRNTLDQYAVRTSHPPEAQDVAAAQREKVRLWSLGERAFRRLANHGYSLCDAAVRSYVARDAAPPSALPF